MGDQIDEVYGYRKNLATRVWEVLIIWTGLPPHESTWKICDNFQQQFPSFHLEYKVILERESNVRPPTILQYSRRGSKGRRRVMGCIATKVGSHN